MREMSKQFVNLAKRERSSACAQLSLQSAGHVPHCLSPSRLAGCHLADGFL